MNRKHILKNGKEIIVVRLTADHLDEILTLQQKVIVTLTTDDFLQPLTKEEFLYMLNGRGLMIGAYCDGQIIAFRAMMEPELDEEHLGIDAGLSGEELPFVLYSEISNVDPDYRGNGLQVLLGKIIMKEVDEKRFCYICATVAPFNIASLKDKFTHGLQIVSLKQKYGNLLRYVLMKDLINPPKEHCASESRYIAMENTEKQQQLLQSGWYGTGIEKMDEQWVVCYKKKRD